MTTPKRARRMFYSARADVAHDAPRVETGIWTYEHHLGLGHQTRPQRALRFGIRAKLRSFWDIIMQKVDASKILEILQTFAALGQCFMNALAIPNALGPGRTLRFPPKAIDDLKEKAEELRNIATEIELPALALTAGRLVDAINDPQPPFNRVGDSIRLIEIQIRFFQEASNGLSVALRDSLAGREFMLVSPGQIEYFKQSEPIFGAKVEDEFPLAIEDISEAAKCFALDRYTATIFHLMRAMENSVQVLGKRLGVTIIDKNNVDLEWGKIVANMKYPIESMPKGDVRDQWSEALTLLLHVKQSWRNPTMHPKKTYTLEEARNILNATNAFMRYLATLL